MMKKLAILLILICLSILPLSTVRAHPADMYSHAVRVSFQADKLAIEWELKSGPLLATWLWNQADANQDQTVSQAEANLWAETPAPLLTAELNGSPLPLKLEKVSFPPSSNEMQAGAAFPVLTFSGAWPEGLPEKSTLKLKNRLGEKNSVNWFGLTASPPWAFQTPKQESSRLELILTRSATPEKSWLREWDSNTPLLRNNPAPIQASPQEVLIGLVKQKDFSLPFYLLALAISLFLGALHALTPGHGKTVVAAYLVGARGTTWHAIVLGAVVTLTHTGSVLLLGVITLLASRYILSSSLIPGLEVLSGALIVVLGGYLLVQRWQEWQKRAHHTHEHHDHDHQHPHHDHAHDHDHHHDHEHDHHHHDGHSHSHAIPETLTWRSLIALGISGGLVPCPDAIAILLVAIALQRIFFGLALIVAFSLGLAMVLIGIGLIMVHSRRLFDRLDAFNRFAPLMPILSALVVLALGIGLTYDSATRLMATFPSAASLEQVKIIYLAPIDEQHKQIFLADYLGRNKKMLTELPNGVSDYTLSPDHTRLVYFSATNNADTEIWLASLNGDQHLALARCREAVCGGAVWAPDGKHLIYEQTSTRSNEPNSGIPTLLWLDLDSGKSEPVFQQSNLAVSNPRWSPDGNWLSFTTPEGTRLTHWETRENRLLPNRSGGPAAWAADSQSIFLRNAVESGSGLVSQVFHYSIAEARQSPVYPDLSQDHLLAAASPDGQWLAVVRRPVGEANRCQLWLIGLGEKAEHRQLTHLENGLYTSLTWSPNGQYILAGINLSYPNTRVDIIHTQTGETTSLPDASNPAWIWP